MVNKVVGFIKFLFAIFMVFYPLSIYAVLRAIFTCKIVKMQDYWSIACCKLFKVRVETMKGSQKIQTNPKTMILLNHRSWSDFFVHDVIAEFSSSFLSRYIKTKMEINLNIHKFMQYYIHI